MPDFPDNYDFTPIFGLPKPQNEAEAKAWVSIGELADRLEAVLAGGIRAAGSVDIPTEQYTESSVFSLLGTPDRVEDIVLEEDGLIFISYRALARYGLQVPPEPSPNSAAAALYLNEQPIKVMIAAAAPSANSVAIQDIEYQWLTTRPRGLAYSLGNGTATDDISTGLAIADPLTGMPGLCVVEAPAGNYDVSVRFKQTAARAYAKNRRLRVWSQSFSGLPPA